MNDENLIPAKKGEIRNPNGRPLGSKNESTIWKMLLEQSIPFEDIDGVPKSMNVEHAIKAAHLKKALTGDMAAIKELYDRTEGKVTDKTQVSGDPENPLNVKHTHGIDEQDRMIIDRYYMNYKPKEPQDELRNEMESVGD